jgi:hypothetical protein
VSKPSHADRLRDRIEAYCEVARLTPPGPERDLLLNRVKQDEIALRLIEWITSADDLPLPSDVIPMTMHRLRRK